MIGIVVGTVCAIGLVHVLRRGRRFRRHGCGAEGYGRGRGGRGGWFVRSLFERLDTTPGQEKSILGALEELRQNRGALREEVKQSRGDLARAVRSGLVDDASLEEAFARHDRLLAQLRVSFVEAVRRAAEALDEGQRKVLADMLEGGTWSRAWM